MHCRCWFVRAYELDLPQDRTVWRRAHASSCLGAFRLNSSACRSDTMQLPSRLICQIYRTVLRESRFGRRPECLLPLSSGECSTMNSLPRRSDVVLDHLRSRFRDKAEDPFAVLHAANERSYALWPRFEQIPKELPAFVLPSHCLLTGEQASFYLFETRYVKMCSGESANQCTFSLVDQRT